MPHHSKFCSLLSLFSLSCILLFSSQNVSAKSNTQQVGDILQIAVPLVAFSSTFLVEDNYDGSWQFVKSAVASELTTLALKSTVNARRPNGSCCDSFPSGHTSAAFMGASFVQFRYGWKYAIPAYVAATYVGYSRVKSNQHYTRDVVAGAAVGILSSYFFTKKYHHVEITPYALNKQYGIQVSGTF